MTDEERIAAEFAAVMNTYADDANLELDESCHAWLLEAALSNGGDPAAAWDAFLSSDDFEVEDEPAADGYADQSRIDELNDRLSALEEADAQWQTPQQATAETIYSDVKQLQAEQTIDLIEEQIGQLEADLGRDLSESEEQAIISSIAAQDRRGQQLDAAAAFREHDTIMSSADSRVRFMAEQWEALRPDQRRAELDLDDRSQRVEYMTRLHAGEEFEFDPPTFEDAA